MRLIFFGSGYCSNFIIPLIGNNIEVVCTHKNKIKTGTYFVEKIMPELIMYSKKVQAGKSSMMDMEVAEF